MFGKLIVFLLLAALTYSCKQTEFAGGGGLVKKPATQSVTPGTKPIDTGSNGSETPIDDGTTAVEEDPESGLDDEFEDPNLDTGNDTDSGPSFLDIIGGLMETLKDADIEEGEDGITFGGRKKFRIGDGQASGSSCQIGLAVHPLSGTKFFFEFEVKEPSTRVDISVESICGVDYGDSNSIYVESLDNNDKYGQQTLSIGAKQMALSSLVLNPGHYAVIVESAISQGPGRGSDADDYVVGKVRIKGNKPMVAGKVGAQ